MHSSGKKYKNFRRLECAHFCTVGADWPGVKVQGGAYRWWRGPWRRPDQRPWADRCSCRNGPPVNCWCAVCWSANWWPGRNSSRWRRAAATRSTPSASKPTPTPRGAVRCCPKRWRRGTRRWRRSPPLGSPDTSTTASSLSWRKLRPGRRSWLLILKLTRPNRTMPVSTRASFRPRKYVETLVLYTFANTNN